METLIESAEFTRRRLPERNAGLELRAVHRKHALEIANVVVRREDRPGEGVIVVHRLRVDDDQEIDHGKTP
jgi:hypothetical protein